MTCLIAFFVVAHKQLCASRMKTMKPLSVPLVNENNLNIEAVELSPGTARVIFNGVLTLRDPAPVLQPFFDRLHTALAEHLYRRVKVDLRGLRFMNSASFKH